MDHRKLVASLTDSERETLLARSDVAGLRQLILHLGAILCTGTWIAWDLPLWQGVMVLHGVLVIFLFTALHESIHNTAFKSLFLNKAVASLCGCIIFLPSRWFRYFHFAHHRHTHHPARDPELATPKPVTWWEYVKYLSGLPVWFSHIKTLTAVAMLRDRSAFVPKGKRAYAAREAQVYLLVYLFACALSLYWQSALLIWVWLLPMLLGQPFLRAYLLAEHTLCPHVANMLENSRTTFTNAFVRFIAWNMPYHAEHHAYPAVPFHKLPLFHQKTRAHLKVTETGYLPFHRKMAHSLTG